MPLNGPEGARLLQTFTSMISWLDLTRARILKTTLKLPALSALFYSRPRRLLILFLMALVFYFLASSFFPLWILLVGPVLWGVPHMIASLRYSSLSFGLPARKKILLFQFAVFILVFFYRVSVDVLKLRLPLSEHALLFESGLVTLSFFYQFYLEPRLNFKSVFSFLAFSALIALTYFFPLQTALAALIGHNYVPLVAWFKSCQNPRDAKVFWVCASAYVTFSLLIFFGAVDPLYHYFSPSGRIGFLDWDYSEVISPYVSAGFDDEFWFHVVILYAFSQAMHYFIWMKAIPENHQLQEHPPSFQWSLRQLAGDFGSGSVLLMAGLSLAGVLIWLFFEFQTARLIYFSLASYHGFMEISNLPFLKSNRKD